MCIIITKERDHDAPSWNKIETSTNNNPDGFAFIYSESKGEAPKAIRMLDRKGFLNAIKPLVNNVGANWILHARIKSVGRISLDNVHGWYDEESGLYFTHNGTLLHIHTSGEMTDSETAFRYLLAPAAMRGRKALAKAANAIVGSSKFALMDKRGEIIRFGNFIEEDGVCYSNSSYKPWTYQAPSFNKGNYLSSWGYGNFGSAFAYEEEEEDFSVSEPDSIGSTKYTKHNNVFLPAMKAAIKKQKTKKKK